MTSSMSNDPLARRLAVRHAFRERILAGDRVLGIVVAIPSDAVIDIVAGAGFDFAMVDLEHSQLAEGDALGLVRHGFALGFPTVPRLADVDRRLVNRLLEAGASGIQISTIRRVQQVEDLVAATCYAPEGRRSIALGHAVAGYGSIPLAEAARPEPPLLVGQIETAATEDPLGAIASAGLDVLFAGTVDLATDLRFDADLLAVRVAEVRHAATAAGIRFGAYAPAPAGLAEGARYGIVSSDLTLLREGAAGLLAPDPRGGMSGGS